MTTALGCLVHLGALAIVVTLVDRATAASLPAALRPWVALVAGTLITLGLSNVWNLARGYGQGESSRRALLRRARAGQPPLEDGPILATGVVRAEGPALVSPVTGQPCVAYQYRIYNRYRVTHGQSDTRVFYWGCACRPFRLDTASEALRVLAMPRLVDDPAPIKDVPELSAFMEGYIRETRFETGAGPIPLASAFALAEILFTEQRLEVRRDWKRADAPAELRGLHIEEQVLVVGSTASAWGQWASDRRGIVPGSLGSETPGIAVVSGPPERLLGHAEGPPSSALAVAIAAVVLLALGGALVWAARVGYVTQMWDTVVV
jgi:hypothetical protein